MQIRHFILAKDGGWTGSIRTLTIDAKVRLVPNDDRNGDNAPAFRALVGNARIGDAWDARTAGDNPRYYLRVRLDDPSLTAPLRLSLFPCDEGRKARLVWNRGKER
ncbi:uncharacterized protein (DUF736 family) [Parvibaculum indicum]|uniref:DUF736 family protein n=1 Tax=Parvibaculum indicum TaxID=562969 RepID=UPI00142387F2|nr:uncharacterized protein (DUF736 family) [Parvibaculum indicum]